MMELHQVTCPYCGREWKEAVDETYISGRVNLIRGSRNSPGRLFSARTKTPSPQRVDLRCPGCHRTFEYEISATRQSHE
jgi:endogenous inhibitor of DNA gyrase (YacG/DUF329 family)